MARTRIEVSNDWTKVSNGSAVVHIIQEGREPLYVNESASDSTATIVLSGENRRQVVQGEAKPLYLKSAGGWIVVVDTAG